MEFNRHSIANKAESGLLIDLDGTIIKKDDIISDSVLNDLIKLKNIIPVSIVSGRGPEDVLKYSTLMGLYGPQYCENGSRIIDGDTGRIIRKEILDIVVANSIFNKIMSLNLQCIVISENKTTINPKFIRGDVSTIVAYSDNYESLSNLEELQFSFNKSIISQRSTDENGNVFLNFHSINSGKDKAVIHFSKYYNIHRSKLFSIGDGENDISMIKSCGNSIAMGNSLDIIKEIAKYTTDDISNDGVSRAINDFIIPNIS